MTRTQKSQSLITRGSVITLLFLIGCISNGLAAPENEKPLEQLQEEFRELRFGMFIHFSIATYYNLEWAKGTESLDRFNPVNLDCEQWAEAAQSAGMKYAVLTTKHVAGFSLWDTAQSDYDVAATPYKKDIVRQYVDAFRKRNMKIGLYFSIWDGHHGIVKGEITPQKVAHIKAQITELLTNYGKVDMLWLDGYQHENRGRTFFPTTQEVPFEEIYELVKKLQPNCLVMRHPGNNIYDTEYSDIQLWECTLTRKHNSKPQQHWWRYRKEHPDNVSEMCDKLQKAWFWKKGSDRRSLQSVETILGHLKVCGENHCNYLLNVGPNLEGVIDNNALSRLKEIGVAFKK